MNAMSLTNAIEAGRKLATAKGMAVYVLRTATGFKASLWCDENPAAVVVIVTPAGDVAGF